MSSLVSVSLATDPTPVSVFDKIFGSPDGVELRFIDEHLGHGLYATRDYAEGELIVTDSPIVSCQFAWNREYNYKACGYCLRALETAEENARRLMQQPSFELPLPESCETQKELHVECPECTEKYCTEECRTKAWDEYHKILCFRAKEPKESHPLKVLDQFWRLCHYPPETMNIMLLVRLLVKIHLDETGLLRERLAHFCQATTAENEQLAHKMLGEEFADQINKLRMLVTAALPFDNIQEYLTPEGFTTLFVLIARNGQGVGSSPFAIWVVNVEKLVVADQISKEILETVDDVYNIMHGIVGHFLDNEGSALYPVQSWVNHSCVPNTDVKFPKNNHDVGLVARRPIHAGEEITITYLDLADMERSRYSRNKYLMSYYLFECQCERCEAQKGDEEVTSDEDDEDDDSDEMDEM